MTTHYIIQIDKNNGLLKVTYKSGKFSRLEKVRGVFTEKQIEKIGLLIPPTEQNIPAYQNKLKGKATITKIEKSQSWFQKYTGAWFDFYQEQEGIAPRFNAADGNHLKQIKGYLESLEQDPEKAFALWQIILKHWDQLDDFFKKSKDIPFINHNLNKIIQNVKRLNTQTGINADYIESIKRDLQS